MYIALCDDNPQDLQHLHSLLEHICRDRAAAVRFQTFHDPEQMLCAARAEPFTHYFLDISMDSMDGITAAQEIRSFDENAVLVFLTSFTEFAYQSYRVRAFDYLLKPISETTLSALMDRLFSLHQHSEGYLTLQNGRSINRFPLSQICYLEVRQKYLYFFMADGKTHQMAGSISQIEKDLAGHLQFVKIHRSYIVNLNHVAALTAQGCAMTSGESLPISRLLYHQVHERFLHHLFSRER